MPRRRPQGYSIRLPFPGRSHIRVTGSRPTGKPSRRRSLSEADRSSRNTGLSPAVLQQAFFHCPPEFPEPFALFDHPAAVENKGCIRTPLSDRGDRRSSRSPLTRSVSPEFALHTPPSAHEYTRGRPRGFPRGPSSLCRRPGRWLRFFSIAHVV